VHVAWDGWAWLCMGAWVHGHFALSALLPGSAGVNMEPRAICTAVCEGVGAWHSACCMLYAVRWWVAAGRPLRSPSILPPSCGIHKVYPSTHPLGPHPGPATRPQARCGHPFPPAAAPTCSDSVYVCQVVIGVGFSAQCRRPS
jgi:hypothetical protein